MKISFILTTLQRFRYLVLRADYIYVRIITFSRKKICVIFMRYTRCTFVKIILSHFSTYYGGNMESCGSQKEKKLFLVLEIQLRNTTKIYVNFFIHISTIKK